MDEEEEDNEDGQQVVYVSEYGASVPAWVSLDTGRWLRWHWGFPVGMMVLAGMSTFLMLTMVSGFLWLVLLSVFLLWRYWNGVRHQFRHGNANPGRVVSVQPPLVAVWTGLDASGEAAEGPRYPAVKVLRYRLPTVLGEPLACGQAVPTASIYEGDGQKGWWTGFAPVFLEEGCGDLEELRGVLGRVEEESWTQLDAAVERLTGAGKIKRVGLHWV
jgi:hypothetical protein